MEQRQIILLDVFAKRNKRLSQFCWKAPQLRMRKWPQKLMRL
jgi:hypothetical protein